MLLGDRRYTQDERSRNNVIKEKLNIKNLVLDFVRYKQLNWHGHMRTTRRKAISNNFGIVYTWRKKKGMSSTFVVAGSNKWKEGKTEI